jgi:hypothetical protein
MDSPEEEFFGWFTEVRSACPRGVPFSCFVSLSLRC